jgi:hypothetical protein
MIRRLLELAGEALAAACIFAIPFAVAILAHGLGY